MPVINTQPSWKPKCPNHGATLEGIPFPIPRKGIGICPVSKCPFEYEVDAAGLTHKIVRDKNGNMVTVADWVMAGDESTPPF